MTAATRPPVSPEPFVRRAPRARTTSGPASGASWSPAAAVREIFTGVEWSPAFIAFLYYFFVVVTYFLPFADIAMVVAVAALLFQPHKLRVGTVVTLVALWLGWAWIGYFTTQYRGVVFEQAWGLTKLFLVVVVAFNVLRSRAQIRFFLAFATVCFVFFPLRGAFVNYFGGYALFGRAIWINSYENPNDLAASAILFGALALGLFALARNRLTRTLSLLAASALLLLIFFTQSRGALLAVALTSLVWGIAKIRNPRVILGAAAMAAVAALFAPAGTWQRLSGLKNASFDSGMRGVDEEGSAEQRLQLMMVAARVAADHPVFGVGIGAHGTASQEYVRLNRSEFGLAGGNRDAHNTYLHIAAELGLPGVMLLLTLCGAILRRGFRAAKRLSPAQREPIRYLSFGLLSFLLAGMFGSFEYVNIFHLHLVVLEAAVLAIAMPEAVSRRPKSTRVSTVGRVRST